MATVTVATVLSRVNTLLNDPGYIRWPKQELLDYFNDASRAIVLLRPDAYTKNVSFSCTAGTKQTLPAEALRLIEIIRNGSGSVIRNVPRRALDDSYPEWHVGNTATKVSAYVYDERDPKTFYLYPGPAAAHAIDLVYSVAPVAKLMADVENVTTPAVADLDDIYINPLIDFILYRAFSKDSEYAVNSNNAASHYIAFSQQLGDKNATDANMAQGKDARLRPGQQG